MVVVSVLAIKQLVPGLNREMLVDWGQSLSDSGFLAAFCLLPLLGFPLTIFLVIAGLKFGIGWGMLLATIAIALHNLIAYGVTKSWAKVWVKRLFDRMEYEMPEIPSQHHVWFTAVFTFVPGLPYAIKLYGLALTNISFRHYFWIGWPIYAVSCILYVGLGDAASSLSLGWFLGFVAAGILLTYVAKRWFQRARAVS